MWCRRCSTGVQWSNAYSLLACDCASITPEQVIDGFKQPPFWSNAPRTPPPAPALTEHVRQSGQHEDLDIALQRAIAQQMQRTQEAMDRAALDQMFRAAPIPQPSYERQVRPISQLPLRWHIDTRDYVTLELPPAPPPVPKVQRVEPPGPRMIQL